MERREFIRRMILSALAAAATGAFGATVSETTIALPTYPYGDPDPVPATSKIHWPYARYDRTSAVAVTQDWKAVVLESDRLRVTALPGVGGKVWGAVDKLTGREFIYFNHAVKFRDVAMCGPWCSGGIEFNFGIIGHHPTTAVPLPYVTRRNGDGSVSYVVGNTERICGTVWQVEVRLKDGDDFFTTRTQWFNASPLEQPYYQWMTAAYTSRGGDPEMAYPGTDWIGHDGAAHPWPIDGKGHDLSRYSGNAFGSAKSYHVVGGDERYFAIWWPDYKLGSYHENAWGEKYGRKIFMWALSRAGGIWEDLLTDTDGQYIELQSGRVFNQPSANSARTPFKHPTFTPGRTDVFTEKWGVVRDYADIENRLKGGEQVVRPFAVPDDFNWESAYGLTLAAHRALRGEQDIRKAKETCARALVADRQTLDGFAARRARGALGLIRFLQELFQLLDELCGFREILARRLGFVLRRARLVLRARHLGVQLLDVALELGNLAFELGFIVLELRNLLVAFDDRHLVLAGDGLEPIDFLNRVFKLAPERGQLRAR